VAHSAQKSSRERIGAAAVAGPESQLSESLFPVLHGFPTEAREEGFSEKVVFSDEAMFHMCGKVNCYNVTIDSVLTNSKTQNTFLLSVLVVSSRLLPSDETCKYTIVPIT
jgi:hypothetical protein